MLMHGGWLLCLLTENPSLPPLRNPSAPAWCETQKDSTNHYRNETCFLFVFLPLLSVSAFRFSFYPKIQLFLMEPLQGVSVVMVIPNERRLPPSFYVETYAFGGLSPTSVSSREPFSRQKGVSTLFGSPGSAISIRKRTCS